MDLSTAQKQFKILIDKLEITDKQLFLKWLAENYSNYPYQNWQNQKTAADIHAETDRSTCVNCAKTVTKSNYDICQESADMDGVHDGSTSNSDVYLDHITEDLRAALPVSAVYHSETILFPTVWENADCQPEQTVHVDAFLYDDDFVDGLCDEGKLQRNYCTQCGSRDVSPLTFISHSSSRGQLKYMFQHLLPELSDKMIIDVGSRLGAALYAAYFYSSSSKIIGVEINPDFCLLQQKIVDKFKMADRVQIINADISTQAGLIEKADVLILNNVFEFFAPIEIQTRIWQFLHELYRKPGSILITSPSLEHSLQLLQTNIDINTWVMEKDLKCLQEQAVRQIYGPDAETEDCDLTNLHLYQVL